MPTYSVHVPLIVQYQSGFDSPTFSSDFAVEMPQMAFSFGQHAANVEEENGQLLLKVHSVEAIDEGEAATIAAVYFERLAAALSLDLQGQNPNSHYGHPRFSWRSRDIRVYRTPVPTGVNVSASLGIKAIHDFRAERSQKFCDALAASPLLGFLIASYYEALGPYDFRSKYYNAFVVIEFIEKNLEKRLATTLLLRKELLDPAISLVRTLLLSHSLSRGDVDRVLNRSLGVLRSATMESRVTKLSMLLREVLGVTSLQYAGQVHQLDDALVTRFIEERNRLFHAAEGTGDLKRSTDLLILTIEKVLLALIGNPSLLEM